MKIFSFVLLLVSAIAIGQTQITLRDVTFTLPEGYTPISQEAYNTKFGKLQYRQFHEAGAAYTADEVVDIKYQYYEIPGITELKLDSVFYDQEKRFREDYDAKTIIHQVKKQYIYAAFTTKGVNFLYGYSVGSKGIFHIQMISRDVLPNPEVFKTLMDGIAHKTPHYYNNPYEEQKAEGAESSKNFIIAGICALIVYLLIKVINKQKRLETE